ncbi:hypothetical protein SAMN06265348_10243 [Pedobacter westerhofensis]|uniref:Uncharacterized protein n=1 Tax=Pedobacter westerhofensis TaxID=425512 RepID=A0A521B674_9SPHI|nr:hypothetical protein [Pedobacter westerhofensis]SMO42612.1 hypothetical protein SAMN06265348_10243 [Pedobacter westerhofensis]
MKRQKLSAGTLVYLLSGLLLVVVTPPLGKHLAMPDMLKGFLTGLGMMLEVIAIIKMQKSRSRSS